MAIIRLKNSVFTANNSKFAPEYILILIRKKMTIHTLYELVQYSVKSFASKVALPCTAGGGLSYAEVEPASNTCRTLLSSRFESGRQGGAVEQQHAQLVRFVPGRHLCRHGRRADPPDFSTEEVEMIIAHSEAKALMVSDETTSLNWRSPRSNPPYRDSYQESGRDRLPSCGGEGSGRIPEPEDLAVIIYLRVRRRVPRA